MVRVSLAKICPTRDGSNNPTMLMVATVITIGLEISWVFLYLSI